MALARRQELWMLLGAAGVGLLLVWLLDTPFTALLLQAQELRLWIRSFGPLAPLIYILVFTAQILLAPVPGQFMAVMGGYLFGVFWGSLYSLLGLLLGAGGAMLIGRKLGRPFLERFFTPEQLTYWERKLRMRSAITWWLLFVFPVPDLVYYVAGLTTVPLRRLLVAVLTGRGLGLILSNVLGSWSAHLPPEWVLIKWTLLLVAAALVIRHQRRVRLCALLAVRALRRRLRRLRSMMAL
ncbi:hypothetical protein RY27_03175 [Litorilinea aerophila]|nr:hypothetical protein RY27_03175 [Litorilinea aerophila]